MTRRRKGSGRVTPKKTRQATAQPWPFVPVELVWFGDHADCPWCMAGSTDPDGSRTKINPEKRNGPRLHPGAVQAQSFANKEQRHDYGAE